MVESLWKVLVEGASDVVVESLCKVLLEEEWKGRAVLYSRR